MKESQMSKPSGAWEVHRETCGETTFLGAFVFDMGRYSRVSNKPYVEFVLMMASQLHCD